MIDFAGLKAEFPREAVSWRAQNVTKDGSKAMALAYIDARDVMDRLDAICGPSGWQCRYSHANGKTVCDIAIKCGEEWVWKADGAGDSDIEAEKGALSDAFKRAAVRWGIGRYLYHLESPWVPCESYDANGKKKFSKFTADPWNYVKGATKAPATPKSLFRTAALRNEYVAKVTAAFQAAETQDELKAAWQDYADKVKEMKDNGNEYDLICVEELRNIYERQQVKIKSLSDAPSHREGSDADIAALKYGTMPTFLGRKQ